MNLPHTFILPVSIAEKVSRSELKGQGHICAAEEYTSTVWCEARLFNFKTSVLCVYRADN